MSYVEQCQACFESADEGKTCDKCEWVGFDANEHLDYFHEAARLGELYQDLLLVLDALDVSPEHQLAICRPHGPRTVAAARSCRSRNASAAWCSSGEGGAGMVYRGRKKSVEKAIAEAVSAPYSVR
jgi:hypothetical protein